MTEQEITELLNKAKSLPCSRTDHRQTRYERYREIISKGVSAELVALLHCFYKKRILLSEQKKSLSSTDATTFAAAENCFMRNFLTA